MKRALQIATLLFASLSWARSETVSSSVPVGFMSASFVVGNNALALPLIAGDVFRGTISSNTATQATFVAGSPSSLLSAAKSYFLEVETGSLEGERIDIDAPASIAAGGQTLVLKIGGTSNSTPSILAAGSLAGDRCVIRQNVTLGSLTTLFSPALTGNNSSAAADVVQLHINGALVAYYLRSDGVTWREVGRAVDESGRVIPPGTSFILTLKSGPKSLLHTGVVRTNDFRVNLRSGSQSFATGFPVSLSPVEVGAAVDTLQVVGERWVGNNSSAVADKLQVYDAGTGAFLSYYLRGDGISWRKVGEATNLQATSLFKSIGMVVVTRTNPDSGFLVMRPFSF